MDTPVDVIQYANQIGRLDFISALLACIAVLQAFGGIIAFYNIKAKAENIARDVAEKTAEKAANEHIQDNLPKIMEDYETFIDNHVKGTVADKIAQAQESE